MRILLTGAHGQLGRALQVEIATRKKHLCFPMGHRNLNISDAEQVNLVLDQIKPNVVINTAAYNFVDLAESEPSQAFSANQAGPENLAKSTASRKITLLHLSTDYVFDGTASVPYVESSPTHPLSVYAKSKEAGEQAVLAHQPESYLIRTAWVYQLGGRNFLQKMLSLKDKPELKVVNDQFGSPTYAPHLAQKIMDVLESNAPFGVYHMAGKGKASWFDLAQLFFKSLGIDIALKPISAADYSYQAVRPRYTVLESERGVSYQLPHWERGVEEFVKEIKNGMRTSKV